MEEIMNYEELYGELKVIDKELKERLALLNRLYKAISKEIETGDMKSLSKNLSLMDQTLVQQQETVGQFSEKVDAFDVKTYFENGDFAKQILECCEQMDVDVQGEYPIFEMFPYRVRIDEENQEIYIDRKKVPCVRPISFVQTLKTSQEKLMKASFNAQTFLNELSDAYDMAILKTSKKMGTDVLLINLYKYLTPMGRFRKDYDQKSFAFDIARLYNSDIEKTKNGRRYQFGNSRDGKKGIRILDAVGKEHFMATVCFIEE